VPGESVSGEGIVIWIPAWRGNDNPSSSAGADFRRRQKLWRDKRGGDKKGAADAPRSRNRDGGRSQR